MGSLVVLNKNPLKILWMEPLLGLRMKVVKYGTFQLKDGSLVMSALAGQTSYIYQTKNLPASETHSCQRRVILIPHQCH